MSLAATARHCEAACAWLRARLERLAAPGPAAEAALAAATRALQAAEAADPPPRAVLLARRLGLSRFEIDLLLLCAAVEWDPDVAARVAALHGGERPAPSFGLAFALLDAPAWDSLAPDRPLRRWRLLDLQAGGAPLTAAPLRGDERAINYLHGIDHLDARLAPHLAPLAADAAPLPPSQQDVAAELAAALGRPAIVQLVGRAPGCARRVAAAAARALGLALHRLPAEGLPAAPHELDELATLWQRESRLTPVALYLDTRWCDRPGAELPLTALARLCQRLGGPLVIDARERLADLADAAVVLDVARPTAAEQRACWLAAGLAPAAAARLAAQFDLGAADIAALAHAPADDLLTFSNSEPPVPADSPAGARPILADSSDRPVPADSSSFVRPAPADSPAVARSVPLDSPAVVRPVPADSPAVARSVPLDDSTKNNLEPPVPADSPDPRAAAAWRACLRHTRPALDALAARVDPRADWDDLVLPPAELALLREMLAQVRLRARVYDDWGFRRRMNRGLGITALFAGESGTGKTMAAEVLARALDLSLHRIDLAAVVSKYIGETEKNLRRLFDAAEGGGAVLLFDEADALFGKRSEVKDSHDRYANIEVNYLLQRLEAYRGLAILATNQRAALDGAFTRRLRFVVHFPFPGPAERERLWRRAFPPEAERAALDLPRLAALNLSGGSIHNIALHAAFLAADAGRPVDMAAVLHATRSELHKLGRPTHEANA